MGGRTSSPPTPSRSHGPRSYRSRSAARRFATSLLEDDNRRLRVRMDAQALDLELDHYVSWSAAPRLDAEFAARSASTSPVLSQGKSVTSRPATCPAGYGRSGRRRRSADRSGAQPECLDDSARAQVKHGSQRGGNLLVAYYARTEGVDPEGDGLGNADRVGQLDFAAARQPGGHHVLRCPARGVRGRAIYLCRVLSAERAAAVAPIPP